jgi:xylan 1,4-beta-xylosidase
MTGRRRTFRNPVLPGAHPDPSVVRVGDDLWLATSTFEYFPGIALHHSRDLVHWRPAGSAIDRPDQLSEVGVGGRAGLDGIRSSGGLYAPTLRYADGVFHLACTLVDGPGSGGGNFLLTATDPAGDWSDPVWLPDAPGFDPSLLFDDDGRAWFCATWERDRANAPGRTEVWLQELDRTTLRLVGERRTIWTGAMSGARWAEGPHVYRIDGLYYLLAAEGGTAREHAVVVGRSEKVTGPYEPCPRNPLLTTRHLAGDALDVTGPGHADLVQLADGSWWALFLASRRHAGRAGLLGRETFLTPVAWEDGWPVLGGIPVVGEAPDLPAHAGPAGPRVVTFDLPPSAAEDGPGVWPGDEWLTPRTPRSTWWRAGEGRLRLTCRPEAVRDAANPSLLARRVEHHAFTAYLRLAFEPAAPDERAGLVLYRGDAWHVRLEVAASGGGERDAVLVACEAGVEREVARRALPPGPVRLGVEACGYDLRFHAGPELVGSVSGELLSDEVAGGFFGTLAGVFATGRGSAASVEWWEYAPLAGCQDEP